jgi:hypothetical protein
VESACNVLGEDATEEEVELVGETLVLKALLLFDLDWDFGYEDCVTNLGWEWDLRSGLDEKYVFSSELSTTAILVEGMRELGCGRCEI